MSANGSTTLCLGEALVDMIGEQPVRAMEEVRRFAPHFGGVVANVAVVAARAGARMALAGSAGEDEWGRWLLDALQRENVDTSRFALRPGVATQLAFVAVDRHGEPTYELSGDACETVVPEIERAAREAAALFITSNTLAGPEERSVTMGAREAALAAARPVIFDVNLRLPPLVLARRRRRQRQRLRPGRAARARQPDRSRADDRGEPTPSGPRWRCARPAPRWS